MRAFVSDINDSGDQVSFSKTDATLSGSLRHATAFPVLDATYGLNKRALIVVQGGDSCEFSLRSVLVTGAEVSHDGTPLRSKFRPGPP